MPMGYVRIGIRNMTYNAHHLAWLYCHGVFPTRCLDHVNGKPGDNRIENLREATTSQNAANKRISSKNKSGRKGVSLCPQTQKWFVQIRVNGRNMALGRYDKLEDAAAAYRTAAVKWFGEFARF